MTKVMKSTKQSSRRKERGCCEGLLHRRVSVRLVPEPVVIFHQNRAVEGAGSRGAWGNCLDGPALGCQR